MLIMLIGIVEGECTFHVTVITIPMTGTTATRLVADLVVIGSSHVATAAV